LHRLGAAEALAIVSAQRATARRRLVVDDRFLYAAWGLAWLIAYGLLWVASRPAPDAMPPAWGWIVFAAALTTALVVTLIRAAVVGQGVRGPSRAAATAWGATWGLAFFGGMWATTLIADQLDSTSLIIALYNAVSCLIVGSLYLACGGLLGDKAMYAVGGWTIAIMVAATAVATAAGVGPAYLVMAFGGGGGMLAGAVAATVAHSRKGGPRPVSA
jgi:hypothetical protein